MMEVVVMVMFVFNDHRTRIITNDRCPRRRHVTSQDTCLSALLLLTYPLGDVLHRPNVLLVTSNMTSSIRFMRRNVFLGSVLFGNWCVLHLMLTSVRFLSP